MTDIIERLSDEADQARNDGADDIAKLLDDAGAEITRLRNAGRPLATIAFNLSQCAGEPIEQEAADAMREACRAWDSALTKDKT